ncbi:unnamed protein product [Rotaria sordida]|uniref:Helix-turn-helix domain-containing protein n=1 Tax=Rotaria sordida TaxID=392033 RepID=A0A819T150_9BILA|nr:unnamed protein product [Rotaria sordida]CAF4071199.1 unnamed protein product [Rotaria sordida]
MTCNKSEKSLKDLLDVANTLHSNIKLEYKIGKSLRFLDVLFTNNNGILTTSVYHKPVAEPYVVPFTSDHPRHVFVNVIQTSLARATRYSSTFESFNNERRYIQLTLLYNGYPSTFIDKEFQKFFYELPETCTDMFRYTIELLFITHAEPNLNTIGNVLNEDRNIGYYPMNNPWLTRSDQWYQGLLRRPQSKSTTSNEIVTTK